MLQWWIPMPVTIKDVAKKAKVAIGTVSRVINDRPDVDAQLRERVQKAIKELNYRPNARARSFVQNTTPVISFIHSNRKLLHAFHSDVLQSVEEYCEEEGYYVMFTRYNYSGDTKRADLKLPNVLRSHGVADCLILAGINYENFTDSLEELGVPYVLFKNTFVSHRSRRPFDQVGWDDFASSYEATKYLIQLGHRHIWYFADCSLSWYRVRYDGYAQAMRESGLEPRGQTVALSENYYANGYACMEVLLESGDPVTAVFAGYDDIAYGAWDALQKRGLTVPGDVSLVGFHDEDQAQFKVPALTTVRVDKFALGRQLAKMAIDKLKFSGKRLPEITLPTTLIKRGTTRPLPRDSSITETGILGPN
jgi:LacI family transcriptional regulator, galactose operon repressor